MNAMLVRSGIAHGQAVGAVLGDQRGGDGKGEALDQDADLRRLAGQPPPRSQPGLSARRRVARVCAGRIWKGRRA